MPNLHDIEKRIKSVSSTKQITRTMEMVAGAKVKYATERIQTSAPYADSMTEMLQGVAARVQASENPLLEKRESVKRVLCVAVVSDRGLAGGFNSNVLRTVEKTIRAKKAQGVEVDVIARPRRCARASSARLPAHVDLPCVDRLCCWRAGRTPHGNALGYRERQRDGGNAVESV